MTRLTAPEVQDQLRKAEKKYDEDMLKLFPVGSQWECFHGSKIGYPIEVLGMSYAHGINVINILTLKKKRVWWGDLRNRQT